MEQQKPITKNNPTVLVDNEVWGFEACTMDNVHVYKVVT